MRPTDVTLGTFEQKVAQALPASGIKVITAAEMAAVKERIRFVLFGANPDELTVAQIGEWLGRVVPAIRRSAAVVEAHANLFDHVAVGSVGAKNLPASLVSAGATPKEPENADETLAAGEIMCALVNDRMVRFNPSNMIVTPMKIKVDAPAGDD